jgi:hypothetical protein
MSGDQPRPTIFSFGDFEADFQTKEQEAWRTPAPSWPVLLNP